VKELSEEMSKWWEEGANALARQGAQVVQVSLPHTPYALPAYYILASSEASSNLSRYDGVRYGSDTWPCFAIRVNAHTEGCLFPISRIPGGR